MGGVTGCKEHGARYAEVAALWQAVSRSIDAINAAAFAPGHAANESVKVMDERAA